MYNQRVFRQLRVAVVVPAFNEADCIVATLAAMPAWLDHVIVVDAPATIDMAANVRVGAAGGATVTVSVAVAGFEVPPALAQVSE